MLTLTNELTAMDEGYSLECDARIESMRAEEYPMLKGTETQCTGLLQL